jgi:hypothetical protein
MNLAIRDVRYHLGRFVLTALGVGLLLATVMAMGGIYRGMVEDALSIVRAPGADLWVAQLPRWASSFWASAGENLNVFAGRIPKIAK